MREGRLLPGKVEEAEAAVVVGPRAEEKFSPLLVFPIVPPTDQDDDPHLFSRRQVGGGER